MKTMRLSLMNRRRAGAPVSPTAPEITASSFNDATDTASYTLTGTAPITLYWVLDASATPPSVAQVKAGLDQGGAAADASGSQGSLSAGSNSFSADVSGVESGTYYLYSVASNAAGDSAVDSEGPLSVDNTAPTVSLSPADNATDVATTANLVMTFSEAMNTTTGTVTLKNVGGATIQTFTIGTHGTWSVGDTVLTLNPTADFVNSATLAVQWSGLEDVSGNPLPDNNTDTTWNFTVVAAPSGITYLGQLVATGDSTLPAFDLTSLSLQENDIVVFYHAVGSNADRECGVSDPVDYNEIHEVWTNSTQDTNLSISWKRMGVTPDTTLQPVYPGTTAARNVGIVRAYRGVDTTTAIDVFDSGLHVVGSTGTANPNPPSITPVTSGALILVCGAGASATGTGATFSTPGDLIDWQTTLYANATFDTVMGVGHKEWTSGAFDPAAFTGNSAVAGNSCASIVCALRPA